VTYTEDPRAILTGTKIGSRAGIGPRMFTTRANIAGCGMFQSKKHKASLMKESGFPLWGIPIFALILSSING
jgi:hypothetical protein